MVRQERRKKVQPFLQDLLKTAGADFVVLVGPDGELLSSVGETGSLDIDTIQPLLVDAGRVSIGLSAALGASTPWNIHYFSGSQLSLYLVSAGFDTSLLIGIPHESDYGQVGSIARHARKTFSEILSIFSGKETAPEQSQDTEDDSIPADEGQAEQGSEADQAPGSSVKAEDFWEDVENKASAAAPIDGETLSYEEARKIGLIQDDISDDESGK